jgi:hypothetical protein
VTVTVFDSMPFSGGGSEVLQESFQAGSGPEMSAGELSPVGLGMQNLCCHLPSAPEMAPGHLLTEELFEAKSSLVTLCRNYFENRVDSGEGQHYRQVIFVSVCKNSVW